MDEKRQFQRIFHDAETQIKLPNGSHANCDLLDISLNGCLVNLSQYKTDINSINETELSFKLGDAMVIEVTAKRVFVSDKFHAGFKFINIDLDSITFLRRLVELNMGDADMLERNLQALSVASH